MAVNPKELMAMIEQGQEGPGADQPTPPPSEQGSMTSPMASPMSTPEPKKGDEEQARLNIMMALDMIQQALGIFGMDTEEGKTLEKVVKEITRRFGERESSTRELMPNEILNLIQNLPQAGGATPGQREALQAPAAGTTAPPLPM
jgi:hypothetical protein